jgi:hypothetical protein
MQASAVCPCPSRPHCLQGPSRACHPHQGHLPCLQDQHQQQQLGEQQQVRYIVRG